MKIEGVEISQASGYERTIRMVVRLAANPPWNMCGIYIPCDLSGHSTPKAIGHAFEELGKKIAECEDLA